MSVHRSCQWTVAGLAWYTSTEDKNEYIQLYSGGTREPPAFPVHHHCLDITFQVMAYSLHEKRAYGMPTTLEELYDSLCRRDLLDRVWAHNNLGCEAFVVRKAGLHWPSMRGIRPCWGLRGDNTLPGLNVGATGAIPLSNLVEPLGS